MQLLNSILILGGLAAYTGAYQWHSQKFDAIEALLYEDAPEPPGFVSVSNLGWMQSRI